MLLLHLCISLFFLCIDCDIEIKLCFINKFRLINEISLGENNILICHWFIVNMRDKQSTRNKSELKKEYLIY